MESWYARHVVPYLLKAGCGCQMVMDRRRAIVPHAAGRVLEIGVGSGLNFRFYDPARVEELVGIEPADSLRGLALDAKRPAGLKVELYAARAERLPFEDRSFDTVVTTFTLCSVDDEDAALSEFKRVLRPGGQILFCEHGLAPDPGVARWQRRIEPVWKKVFVGCRLARPVRANIERFFAVDRHEVEYMPRTPKFAGWLETGRAVAA